jgi:hypothetical protein
MTKPNSTNTKATLKRKVGYVDEEASVTRTKFAQMELTQMESMQMEITKGNENEGKSDSVPPS